MSLVSQATQEASRPEVGWPDKNFIHTLLK